MTTRYPIIFLLFAVLLAGCGAARPSKYYQLTVPGDNGADAPGDALPVTIVMGPLLTSHLYREDHIVYSSTSEAMGTYEYQRWAEPPTEMIEQILFRALRASTLAQQVPQIPKGSLPDVRIAARLLRR